MLDNNHRVRVWDPLVRLFHWALAAGFFIAYFTEDDWQDLHVLAGYTVLGLVLFRLVWGFVGPRHARFSEFVHAPSKVLAYLKDAVAFRAKRHLGHNPAGGAMVVALLVSLLIATVSGLALYGQEETAGPLASLMGTAPHWLGEALEEAHEFFANFTLLLVLLHLAGIALASFQHGENLPLSMITGRKSQEL